MYVHGFKHLKENNTAINIADAVEEIITEFGLKYKMCCVSTGIHDYPHTLYAKNFMTTQASSVPSEQLFSQAGCVVTKLRASLSSDSIEVVLCLKSWFKGREMRELFMNQR
ncbi:hypothetical protein GEMRC1_002324 [Eukaryota sp. GEM-RC1]